MANPGTGSILITSQPFHGHVLPLLAVVRELVAAGRRVRMLSGSRYRERIEAAGAEFVALPAEIDFDDSNLGAYEAGEQVNRPGLGGLRSSLVHFFIRPAPLQYAAVRAAIAAEPTAAVLTDSTFIGAISLTGLPRAARPPVVACGLSPLPIPRPGVPPFGLGLAPSRGPLGRLRDRLAAVLVQRLLMGPLQAELERVVGPLLGDALSGRSFLELAVGVDLMALFTVPGLDYPQYPMPENVRYYGPLIDRRPSAAAAPEWFAELDGELPVVHVTQGTVANEQFGELVLPAIRGLAAEPVLVAATLGGRAESALGEAVLPANTRVASYLPYDRLLPGTDVFVTNGGFGGVQQALAHGIPVIVVGATQEKPEVLARLRHSGAGLGRRRSAASSPWLRGAVRRVLASPAYREAAGRIADEMAAARGVPGLIEDLAAL